jgi:hypothetical protein
LTFFHTLSEAKKSAVCEDKNSPREISREGWRRWNC